MSRIILFVLLVLALPSVIYWAGHQFERPDKSVGRFFGEVRALVATSGSGTDYGAEGDRLREERERRLKEQAEAEAKTEAESEAKRKQETEPETEPTSPIEVEKKKPDRREVAGEHYRAGRFAIAAKQYAGLDDRMRSLSDLGAAFSTAVPESLPSGRYFVVRTRTGEDYEGFGRESGGLLTLTSASGKSQSFPRDALSQTNTLSRDEAIDRIAVRVRREAADPGLRGSQLFALIEEAFAAGRPDVAAPLLGRALEIDEDKPFFLSSVRNRIDSEHQPAMYRAFAACQVSQIMAQPDSDPIATVQAPKTLTGTTETKRFDGTTRRRGGNPIKSKEARALMRQAAPLRKEGQDLYRSLYSTPLTEIDVREIDKAVDLLDRAAALYEKAILIEDADEIAALMRHCSKLNFQLRFWKQQAEGR